MKGKIIAALSGIIVFLGASLAGVFAISVLLWLLQLAWNSVMPLLFGVAQLTLQQTSALLFLAIVARLVLLPIPVLKDHR